MAPRYTLLLVIRLWFKCRYPNIISSNIFIPAIHKGIDSRQVDHGSNIHLWSLLLTSVQHFGKHICIALQKAVASRPPIVLSQYLSEGWMMDIIIPIVKGVHEVWVLYYLSCKSSCRRICIIHCDRKSKIIHIPNPKFLTKYTWFDMESNWSCLTF